MGWRLLDWTRLTGVPYQDEVFGPLAIAYLVVFGLIVLVSAALYFRAPHRIASHAVKHRMLKQIAATFFWISVVALAFFGFRIMGLPLLGIRLWLWVMVLVVLGAGAYYAYLLRARFPERVAAYDAEQLKRRYQQAARRRVSPDGQPLPRSARAAKRAQRAPVRHR